MQKFKIGVLREEKSPPDKRVPLTPLVCTELLRTYPNLEIVIQPSKIRCYSDDEYAAFGIPEYWIVDFTLSVFSVLTLGERSVWRENLQTR